MERHDIESVRNKYLRLIEKNRKSDSQRPEVYSKVSHLTHFNPTISNPTVLFNVYPKSCLTIKLMHFTGLT